MDKEKTKAMERAELKYRKLNMGKIPYFPGLVMKANSVMFLKAIKRRENGANVNLRYHIKMPRIAEYQENISKGE